MRYILILILFFGCDNSIESEESNNNSKVFVTLQDSDQVAIVNSHELDLSELISINLIDMAMNEAPHDVAVDNTNNYWFTTAMMGGDIGMYSTIDNEFISSFTIGHMPALLTLDETNMIVYVSRGMPMNGMETNIIYELSYENNSLQLIEQWAVEFDYAHGIHFDEISKNVYTVSKTNDYIAKINPNEVQVPFINPLLASMDSTINYNHTIEVNRLRPIEITSKYPYMFITCSAGEWSTDQEYEEIPGQVQMWHMDNMNLLATFEFDTYARPWHIEASPIGDKVFVSLSGGDGTSGDSDSGVACLTYTYSNDEYILSESWKTTSSEYGTMHGITIHPDCNGNYHVYSTGRTDGNIYKFDANTGEELGSTNLIGTGSVRTGGIDSYILPCD